jgi:hypothetical protein
MTGSRSALLGLSTLILARMHHLRPSSDPVFISAKRFKFSSTEESRRFDAMPSMRSARISTPCSATARRKASVRAYLLLFCVISIGLAALDEPNSKIV